jgi:hypothetical protein
MIPLSEILEDTTYQLRDSSQGKNIPELKRVIGDGFELKPITVMWTVKGYRIIDDFQRVEATRQLHGINGMIKARVCRVPHKVAIMMAAAANQTHGGQLEKADREKIAKALLLEFPKKSNVQIAKLAFLSEGTIRKYRKEMPDAQSETRIGSDGREISLPPKKDSAEPAINEAGELFKMEDSTPTDKTTSTGSMGTEISDEINPDSQDDSCDASTLEKEALTTSDQKKTATRSLNKSISKVEILLSQFNDLQEHIDSAQAFLDMVSHKEVLSNEEEKLVSDLQGIVHKIEVFS